MILHGNFGQEAPYNSVHNSRKNQNCAKCKVLFYEGNERNEGNPENVWYTFIRRFFSEISVWDHQNILKKKSTSCGFFFVIRSAAR
jgi:hypothetical protein